jgi:multidrug resistance protein
MEAEFGNSREVSILGLSFFVLGIGLGPMLLGPMSEFYGRRLIYIVSWTLYVVFIIPQAVAQNIETVVVSRFLDGFAGSAFLAVSGGTVGDLFTANELQAPMLMFSLAPFVGPSIGPLIGGLINYNTDWRWTHWTLLIWAFVLLLAIVLLVPETYRKSNSAPRGNLSQLNSIKIPSCSRTKPNRCERKLETKGGKPLQKRSRNQPPAQ